MLPPRIFVIDTKRDLAKRRGAISLITCIRVAIRAAVYRELMWNRRTYNRRDIPRPSGIISFLAIPRIPVALRRKVRLLFADRDSRQP